MRHGGGLCSPSHPDVGVAGDLSAPLRRRMKGTHRCIWHHAAQAPWSLGRRGYLAIAAAYFSCHARSGPVVRHSVATSALSTQLMRNLVGCGGFGRMTLLERRLTGDAKPFWVRRRTRSS